MRDLAGWRSRFTPHIHAYKESGSMAPSKCPGQVILCSIWSTQKPEGHSMELAWTTGDNSLGRDLSPWSSVEEQFLID